MTDPPDLIGQFVRERLRLREALDCPVAVRRDDARALLAERPNLDLADGDERAGRVRLPGLGLGLALARQLERVRMLSQ
jgi:hypothetical protein